MEIDKTCLDQAEEVFHHIRFSSNPNDYIQAIAQALFQAREKAYKKGQDDQLAIERKMMESVDHTMPMGVSQWREYGQKFGYWDFFEKEAKLSAVQECVRAVEADQARSREGSHAYEMLKSAVEAVKQVEARMREGKDV